MATVRASTYITSRIMDCKIEEERVKENKRYNANTLKNVKLEHTFSG